MNTAEKEMTSCVVSSDSCGHPDVKSSSRLCYKDVIFCALELPRFTPQIQVIDIRSITGLLRLVPRLMPVRSLPSPSPGWLQNECSSDLVASGPPAKAAISFMAAFMALFCAPPLKMR